MRKLSQNLGLGLLSSLFLVIPACGDDGDGDTGTQSSSGHATHGNHTNPTVGTNTNPTAGTNTNPTAGTNTNPTGGTNTNPTAGTNTNPTAGTNTNPTAGTNTNPTAGTNSTDTTGGGGSEGAAVTPEIEGLIKELCAWTENCCKTGEFNYIFGNFAGGTTSCVEKMKLLYESNAQNDDASTRMASVSGSAGSLLNALAFTVDPQRSKPIATEVTRCANHIKTLGCNEPLNDDRCTAIEDQAKAPCRLINMFEGRVKQGQMCSSRLVGADKDIECVYGTSCDFDPNAPGGSTIRVCVKKGSKVNDTCFAEEGNGVSGDCEYDMYCNSQNQCKKRPVLGEACSFKKITDVVGDDFKHMNVPCAEPYTCDPHTNTCVQACTTGTACTADTQCADGSSCLPYYKNGQVVEDDGGTFPKFCGAKLGLGGKCDTQEDCGSGLYCNDIDTAGKGTCASYKNQGDVCQRDFQCGSNMYCDNDATDAAAVKSVADATTDNDLCTVLVGGEVPADDDKCDGDGHRACFKGSLGCFRADVVNGNAVMRCISAKLKDGRACNPQDTQTLKGYDYLRNDAEWKRLMPNFSDANATTQTAWDNMCNSGICAPQDANNDPYCQPGADENQACDYQLNDYTKATCKPGLVCRSGQCKKPLESGSACSKSFNTDAERSGNVLINGFGNDLCDPDTACTDFGNEARCSLVTASKRRNNCMSNSKPGL